MKYIKLLLVSCLFVITFCAAASAQNLNIGMVPLPCSSYGATANLPITLTNAAGISIAGVSADITFDDTYFEYLGASIGAAGTAATKDISGTLLSAGKVRIGVFSATNTNVIGNGVVAIVNFKLLKNPVGGVNIGIAAGASDPTGAAVVITSTTTGGFFTVKTGDINMDGTVSVSELLSTINMFLGLTSVNPICDVNGDGIVQISDVIKVVNCALETATCACEVTPPVTSEETKWQGSSHADSGSEAFNHWNSAGSVQSSCAKCHSTQGYVNYVTNPAAAAVAVPTGQVITCNACHDEAAEALTSVIFESSGSTIAPVVTKVTVTGLGAEARCIVCHQGRQSKASIDGYITTTRATGLGTGPDVVDVKSTFQNVHYLAAAGVQYGTITKVGYEYSGKTYDAKFKHVDGYDTCITCHDQHSLELKYDACVTCHTVATNEAGVRKIRMNGSLTDFDGDGDITTGMYTEVQNMKAKLLTAIRQYALLRNPGKAIGYSEPTSPYWFVDTNNDGVIDTVTETTSYGDTSPSTNGGLYTARLLKATYNYQLATKDPGSYAHGGKYIIELLYDSIQDINAGILILNPAAVLAVDLSKLTREDEGHFDGAAAAYRHWDAVGGTGVIPGGSTGCVKCHADEAIPFFLTNGINIADTQGNGMMCVNCHSSVTDGIAPHTAPRRVVANVTFPSGLTATFGATNDSNLCTLCHQGRESKVSVDATIAAAPASTTLKLNTAHYLASGATLFGTQVKGGYEYATKTYTGQNPYSSHGGQFNTCVQCHMGSDSPFGLSSHNVADINPVNCVCHNGNISETPGAFTFDDIRPPTGGGSYDFDNDGNVNESLKSEIDGLQAELLARMNTYAFSIPGINRGIVWSDTYPYFIYDANSNGALDAGESTAFGNHYDAKLYRAAYNYFFSKKDPGSFIHNPLYIAQLLNDSIVDLGGTDKPWRATATY